MSDVLHPNGYFLYTQTSPLNAYIVLLIDRKLCKHVYRECPFVIRDIHAYKAFERIASHRNKHFSCYFTKTHRFAHETSTSQTKRTYQAYIRVSTESLLDTM